MSHSTSAFQWIEKPLGAIDRVRPEMEGHRCFGGGTCIAPPQVKGNAGISLSAFERKVRASEKLVEEMIGR